MPAIRSAVRFPLHIPLRVYKDSVEGCAETKDISSGGVCFSVDMDIEVGNKIGFSFAMPARSMGASKDVLVRCVGRVVRCSPEDGRREVAAVIDDYFFVR